MVSLTAGKNYFFAQQGLVQPAAQVFFAGAEQQLLHSFFVLAQDTRDSEATATARARIRVIELRLGLG